MLCWKCHSSSSSLCRPQSSPIPNAIRATRLLIAPIARGGRNTPFSFTLRSQASDPYVQQRPATSLYRQPSTTGTSPRRRSSPADYRIVVQSRRRRHVQSATHLQFVSNRTTAVPVLRRIVPTDNMADGKPELRPFIRCRNNVATVIQRPVVPQAADVLIDYSHSLLIVAVRPAQHPAAALRFTNARRPCMFSSSTAVSSSSSPISSQLS